MKLPTPRRASNQSGRNRNGKPHPARKLAYELLGHFNQRAEQLQTLRMDGAAENRGPMAVDIRPQNVCRCGFLPPSTAWNV